MIESKKILVTGGSGFIGSNLIRRLLKNHPNWFIINLDKLTYAGNPKNLKDIENSPNYLFSQGDVSKKMDVDSLINIEGPDVVIHMAAESHVDRSIARGNEFIETNLVGTFNVLEACRTSGVKKVIYISTDEVYGSITSGNYAEEGNVLNPSSVYSASKAGGDLLAMAFWKTYSLPILITRSVNNYGPYQYPEKFIPLIITNLLEGKKIPVYGTGLNVRDWIHVEDNCAAIELLIEKGEVGQAYNISARNEHSNMSIALSIIKLMDKSEKAIEHIKDRPGHDLRYAINDNKIRSLGWIPKYGYDEFAQGLIETIQWYKDNEDWWREIKTESEEYKTFYNEQYGEQKIIRDRSEDKRSVNKQVKLEFMNSDPLEEKDEDLNPSNEGSDPDKAEEPEEETEDTEEEVKEEDEEKEETEEEIQEEEESSNDNEEEA